MTELEWMEIFSRNLVDIMKEARISQRELSDMIGVSEGTISKYIRMQQMPGVKTIINIAYALDYNFDDIIDFGDKID